MALTPRSAPVSASSSLTPTRLTVRSSLSLSDTVPVVVIETEPRKSLPACVSTTGSLPALMFVAPVTVTAPPCVIAPALPSVRSPPTCSAVSLSAPVALSPSLAPVTALTSLAPDRLTVRSSLSLTDTAPVVVIETAPLKSLLVWVSATDPLPALMFVTPATVTAPVCVIAPALVTVSFPPTVVAASAVAPPSLVVSVRSLPSPATLPPASSVPLAVSVTSPVASNTTDSALLSVSVVCAPETVTTPPNSLFTWVSVMF